MASSSPAVHLASFAELDSTTAYELWKLRSDVFVVEQRSLYLDLDGHDREPGTRHVWIAAGDRPIAYLRIIDDAGVARIGRVCVAPEHRGEGLAEQLLQAALEDIGAAPSVLDAQTYLAGWYERLGYEVTGAEFLDAGVAHVPMRRPAS